MNNNELLKMIEQKLGEISESITVRKSRRIYIDVPPEFSLQANRILFAELQARLATATGMDTPDRIEVLYHYCFDSSGVVVSIRTWALKPECVLDSVATLFPGANFIEREIQDLLGVRFENHPDPRRLLLADNWPEGKYPLRRDQALRRERTETPELKRQACTKATTP